MRLDTQTMLHWSCSRCAYVSALLNRAVVAASATFTAFSSQAGWRLNGETSATLSLLGRQFDNTRGDRLTGQNYTCGAVFSFWNLPKQLAIRATEEVEIRRKQNRVQRHHIAPGTTRTLCSCRHKPTLAFPRNAVSMSISVRLRANSRPWASQPSRLIEAGP